MQNHVKDYTNNNNTNNNTNTTQWIILSPFSPYGLVQGGDIAEYCFYNGITSWMG